MVTVNRKCSAGYRAQLRILGAVNTNLFCVAAWALFGWIQGPVYRFDVAHCYGVMLLDPGLSRLEVRRVLEPLKGP